MEKNNKKLYYTTAEVANLLGVSRIAVFKKIKSGKIKASKMGRNYLISKDQLPEIFGEKLTDRQKHLITEAVSKTVKDYGETLRLLGQE
ncbi:MAG: excisionase family DNA-binding protein [Patescibacteria group bacterium]|nr:excisionase family DNA-binding protein [Patescibacteria group bacterium]